MTQPAKSSTAPPPKPERGALSQHIRDTCKKIDTWPQWMRPAYLKEQDR